MATLQKSVVSSLNCVLQPGPEWPWTIPNQTTAEDADVVQGRIFWLPAEEDLPKGAVERVHGKGVGESIYGHPVVIVSRPAEESHIAHFQIISSLQRITIGDSYNISSEFQITWHTSRIPITPSHGHPDVTSKMTKNQFPILRLVDGARLRADSYVKTRRVYKIDWSLLKVYTNPETPDVKQFRFGHKSTRRLLAETLFLTGYEPGTQYQTHPTQAPEYTNCWSDIACTMPMLQRSMSEPVWVSKNNAGTVRARRLSDSETRYTKRCGRSRTFDSRKSCRSSDDEREYGRSQPSKSLSNAAGETAAHSAGTWAIGHPLNGMFRRSAVDRSGGFMAKTHPSKREKSHVWVNAKGAMAVIIASI